VKVNTYKCNLQCGDFVICFLRSAEDATESDKFFSSGVSARPASIEEFFFQPVKIYERKTGTDFASSVYSRLCVQIRGMTVMGNECGSQSYLLIEQVQATLEHLRPVGSLDEGRFQALIGSKERTDGLHVVYSKSTRDTCYIIQNAASMVAEYGFVPNGYLRLNDATDLFNCFGGKKSIDGFFPTMLQLIPTVGPATGDKIVEVFPTLSDLCDAITGCSCECDVCCVPDCPVHVHGRTRGAQAIVDGTKGKCKPSTARRIAALLTGPEEAVVE